ncbi:MAG TPA: FadR/GntR family transcriptional regulator [Segeticoccus sp.]|uniref:FadR/GntR family transcriptional regulator n=1 Tax=Segeticoccus sp. TaxID=2706531 RepID=UPI002D7EFDA6|nr:FadR/GntR family transcriptional regulator [Segeticoccus sp.]HET8601714.1 FadR/GntR family transcriptional regulator [Segeticoccus sp.]
MTDHSTFRPVRPVRLYQRIVEQVEDALARGELKPGQRLPSERDLVTQFGASRSTVREALRVLESNGVVQSRPGDPNGPEVLPFSPGGLTKQLTRLARVDELSLAELISSRMILDSSANRLAARLRTDEQLAEIEAAIEAMRSVIDDGYEQFSEADVAFHEAVARASRNTLIQICNQVVRDVTLSLISDKIAHAHNRKARMRESVRHHQEVLDAIRAGDGPAAARTSRRNLFDYYAGYLPKSEREPLRALLDD